MFGTRDKVQTSIEGLKYFEFHNPYYALIQAKSKEDAVNIYGERVTDLEEADMSAIHELTREEAFKHVLEAYGMDNVQDLVDYFNSKEPILLIDDCL